MRAAHSFLENPLERRRARRERPAPQHLELISCGLHGHVLVGTDVAEVRSEDALVVRQDSSGLRWCRCLRCDAWLPQLPPTSAERDHLPPLEQIPLPLRGKALSTRYVLRLIAVDRFSHFLLLGVLAAGVLLFASNQSVVDRAWFRVLHDIQTGFGGPSLDITTGILGALTKLVTVQATSVLLTGLVLAAYALLEGTEAVGLWNGRRWAEYLTLVATASLLVPEILELTKSITVLKMLALIINLAVVIYLLFTKRLFGLRGGVRADKAEEERDSGWAALRRTSVAAPASARSSRVVLRPRIDAQPVQQSGRDRKGEEC